MPASTPSFRSRPAAFRLLESAVVLVAVWRARSVYSTSMFPSRVVWTAESISPMASRFRRTKSAAASPFNPAPAETALAWFSLIPAAVSSATTWAALRLPMS